ncbi:MAG: hypothetical protein U0271_48305 [Polyangiaceae bacterium]
MKVFRFALSSRAVFPAAFLAMLIHGAAISGCAGESTDTDTSDTNPPPGSEDTDGDTILDSDEGTDDVDGDGVPNNEDTDSDGDGIADKKEAGDEDTSTPPRDSDDDGTPDFIDDDSDNNGILDIDEGGSDADNDSIVDADDLDNDGDGALDIDEIPGNQADCNNDGIPDEVGSASNPQDCDKDGADNFMDLDSDGDSIGDTFEGFFDTDADGFVDRYDLDSDNDGITDLIEGQTNGDPTKTPVDSDNDGKPDFLDPDSDDDGLSDLLENQAGSDPTKADSDEDGVSDLIEVAAGTNPNDPADNPQANGDFVFLVPYQKPTSPTEDTLRFRTSIQFADLYFVIDTTGSMTEEFATLQGTLSAIVDTLACDVVPNSTCALDQDCTSGNICFQNQCIQDPNTGQGCVPNMWTGVGLFNDLDTYRNQVSLQANPATTANAIDAGGFPGGSEAIYQAPACAANPAACLTASYTFQDMNCSSTGIGCAGFRPEAIRILLEVSDADNQCFGAGCAKFTAAYTGGILVAQDIKYVSLYGTDDGTGQVAAFTALALAAQSVDQNGTPFVYPAANAAVQAQTVQAVLDIVKGKPISVTIEAKDQPNDAGDALQFIDYLEANVSGQNDCTMVDPVVDSDNDTHLDAFPTLLPGIPVCWDVHPVPVNMTVPPAAEPQLFIARLRVLGDGSLVDHRDVYFLVPPKPADIPQ